MYKVTITHEGESIEYPFDNPKQARDMYLKQVVHYAELCAMIGDKCTVRLQGIGIPIEQTTIESIKAPA